MRIWNIKYCNQVMGSPIGCCILRVALIQSRPVCEVLNPHWDHEGNPASETDLRVIRTAAIKEEKSFSFKDSFTTCMPRALWGMERVGLKIGSNEPASVIVWRRLVTYRHSQLFWSRYPLDSTIGTMMV